MEARPDVIVGVNTPGARAAIQATKQIPIVITATGDPVGSGFVSNLARPGGNVAGISNLVAELAPKRLALLKEVVPDANRIAVLFNPDDPITVHKPWTDGGDRQISYRSTERKPAVGLPATLFARQSDASRTLVTS